MTPFSFAIPFGLLGPALAVGAFAFAVRGSLKHLWWFVGIGGIASYVLMAACLTWAMADVGITGNLPSTPKPALDPVLVGYLSFMLVWAAGSAAMLVLTRYLLSKI